MAENCESLLSADILKNCDHNPVAGLEVNMYFFNIDDIDRTNITVNASNDLLLDNFQLKSGKTGYVVEGIKQSNSLTEELVIKDYANYYKHLIGGVILNPTAKNRKSLETILSGGNYCVVVEKKWKGTDGVDAFVIVGLDVGVTASTKVYNSKENDGVEMFELASADGYEEPRPYRSLLMTNYATTKLALDGKFVQA